MSCDAKASIHLATYKQTILPDKQHRDYKTNRDLDISLNYTALYSCTEAYNRYHAALFTKGHAGCKSLNDNSQKLMYKLIKVPMKRLAAILDIPMFPWKVSLYYLSFYRKVHI